MGNYCFDSDYNFVFFIKMKKLLGIVILGFLVILTSNRLEAKTEDYKFTKILEDLNSPWSLSFVRQNEVLITEKPGNITVSYTHLRAHET